jgi:SAM-dependent methyltransferase
MKTQISARNHIDLHASQHPMEFFDKFETFEAYGLHLMHSAAYEEAAGLVPHGRVLDLGCNNGYGSYKLSRYGHEVVGVDVSAEALADAKRRFSTANLGIRRFAAERDRFDPDTIVAFAEGLRWPTVGARVEALILTATATAPASRFPNLRWSR